MGEGLKKSEEEKVSEEDESEESYTKMKNIPNHSNLYPIHIDHFCL